jgi:hypothetical protein
MEILNWNADRRHLQGIYFYDGEKRPLASFSFDRTPAEGVRPFHLMIWQYPCAHFFSRSPAMAKALTRLFNE